MAKSGNSGNTGNIGCTQINTKKAKKIVSVTKIYKGKYVKVQLPKNSSIENRSQQHLETTPLNKDLLVFKKKLQDFYKELTLPRIAWLDIAEDLGINEYFVDIILNVSKELIEKQQIFNEIDNERPTRILIESQPGYGKTSLTTRMAYDWTMEEEYIKHFKLVFLLPLRELRQQSIQDAISRIAKKCGFKDVKKVEQLINNYEEDILFLLDGLDEISIERRTSILQILYKQMYTEASVIITCRTGLFRLQKFERTKLFGEVNRGEKFWHKHISVLGVQSKEKKLEFLKKFIDNPALEYDILLFLQLSSDLELFNSPLFLILLAYIVNTEETVTIFLTQTELYKKLFNCIIKQSCLKNNYPIDKNFDLFANESTNNEELISLVSLLGKLSLQNILENNMQFERNESTDKIYNFGLLTNHSEVTRFKSKHYYEVFHFSILEFSVAFYIWKNFKTNEFCEKTLELLVNHVFKYHTSVIPLFLFGLFQEDFGILMPQLMCLAPCFSSKPDNTSRLIRECSSNDVLKNALPFISEFIPSNVSLLQSNMQHQELIKYGIECGKIETVWANDPEHLKYLKNTSLHRLIISVEESKLLNKFLLNMPIKVDNILLVEILFDEITSSEIEEFQKSLLAIASQNLTSFALKINLLSYMPELLNEENLFDNILFNYLELEISFDPLETRLVQKLLQNNQVKGLNVLLDLNSFVIGENSILKAASQSDALNSLRFQIKEAETVNDNVEIDLYELTNDGNKKYNYLNLKNCFIKCKLPLQNKNCFHSLSIDNINNSLKMIDPVHFKCAVDDVEEIIRDTNWNGFNTLKSLCLINPKFSDNLLGFLSKCKNLEILEIRGMSHDESKVLAQNVQQLLVKKLIINYSGYLYESNYKPKLFKYINKFWDKNNQNYKLEEIDFIFDVFTETDTVPCSLDIEQLMESLKNNYWKTVNLITCNLDVFKLIDLSVFNVNRYTYGSKTNDSEWHKYRYNFYCIAYPEHVFNLTVKPTK